jgi:hypothetical protein
MARLGLFSGSLQHRQKTGDETQPAAAPSTRRHSLSALPNLAT